MKKYAYSLIALVVSMIDSCLKSSCGWRW